ncbi:MAG: InlB B-repeat-containing protein, partial [Halanaerobiales bacterium]
CDSDSGDEVMIKEVEDIPAVEVPYGTSGEDVISNYLPESADVELSNDETVTVNIGWEVPDDYSGTPENAPKTYTFEGAFNIEGEDLTDYLEIEVTVLEEDPFTEDMVNISYHDLNLDDVETVTSSNEESATVEDDPDNDQIVIVSVSEGSNLTITIRSTEENEATVVVDVAEDGTITETVEPYGTKITDIATIEGSPEDGETLTAGELTPADATADYKWQYKDGSDWEDLTDGESYTVNIEGDALSDGDDVRVVAAGTGDYYGEVKSATVTIVVPETGSIKGNVKDSDTNDNIEGVTVELEVEGEIYSDTTNDNGDYTLENLPLGEHEVKAEHNNYDSATETAPGIEEDGGTVTQEFSLNESKIDAAEIAYPTESDPAVVQSGETVEVDYEAEDINFDEATLVVEGNGEEMYNDTIEQGDKTQDIDLSDTAEGEYDVKLTVTDTAGNEKSVKESGAIVVEVVVTEIDIQEQPEKLGYVEGDILELDGMEILETYNDGSTENVNFTDGTAEGYTVDPDVGTELTAAEHDDTEVEVTHTDSGSTAAIDRLSVNLPYITDITEVEDIDVDYDTAEDDVREVLAETTTITDSEGEEHTVDLDWSLDAYDGESAGDYDATGTFELPEGVEQSDSETDLEVSAVVTVAEPVPCFEISEFSAPASAIQSEEIGDEVSATITNTGDVSDTQTVKIQVGYNIDGGYDPYADIYDEEITLEPGGSHEIVDQEMSIQDGVGTGSSKIGVFSEDDQSISAIEIYSCMELTLEADPSGGGTVTDNTDDAPYKWNDTVSLTASPNDGYEFVNWTVDGNEVSTEPTFDYTIEEDTTLTANFEELTYSVEISSASWDFGTHVSSYDGKEMLVAESVTRTGTGVITNLEAELTGEDPDAFVLDLDYEGEWVSTLDDDTESVYFSVYPKDELDSGSYSATVSITADNDVSETFEVSFEVN